MQLSSFAILTLNSNWPPGGNYPEKTNRNHYWSALLLVTSTSLSILLPLVCTSIKVKLKDVKNVAISRIASERK